jgi:hypothetical protein
MTSPRLWALAIGVLCAGLAPAWAGPPVGAPAGADDARQLAARIDELIAVRLRQAGVRPAPLTDDAVFLRRLSLDVTGKIPSVHEARRFLADKASDKRARAIEDLLDSPGHVTHFAAVWRDLLIPEAATDFQHQFLARQMEQWLRQQFTENVPYDRMVHELIGIPFPDEQRRRFAFYGDGGLATPLSFYLSKEGKPENLAAATARLFLGVRLECAQCHDHPFGRWTREQFWGQAAFFAGIRAPKDMGIYGPLNEVLDRRELSIPGTERVAQARFLDDTEPQWRYKTGARATLADWVTSPKNPFFARATANRMWAHFFGVGLVEPVDDLSDANPPSHPELLDELARQFVAHHFDLKFLVRAITLSETYQRGSVHPSRPDLRLFACMPVRGLSPDQLYASFVQATGSRAARNSFRGPVAEFLSRFPGQERPVEYQASIPQALALMNSRLMADATNPSRSEVLAAVLNAPFLDTAARVETLFLAALSRRPRPDEAERFVKYVEKGGATNNPKTALGDVFWALLNSPEFILNH